MTPLHAHPASRRTSTGRPRPSPFTGALLWGLAALLPRGAAAQDSAPATPEGRHALHRPGRMSVGLSGGVQLLFGVTGGLELGAFVHRRVLLTANTEVGVNALGPATQSAMLGVGGRFFLGDTFHLAGTFLYRSEKNEWTNAFEVSGVTRASYLVLGFGLGNRWDFDGWFLGCEWAGFTVPLAQLSERITVEDAGEPDTRLVRGAGWEIRALTTMVGLTF